VRTALRLLLSLAIAAGLLAILFAWGGVTPRQVLESWDALAPEVWALAMGIHLGVYLLRAARFRLLLPPASRPPLLTLLSVSSSHNLAAYVLPAKTGEGTLVLYLKRVCGVSAGEGLASLVVSRLLDLATLSLLLGGTTLALVSRGSLPGGWGWPLGAGLGLLAVSLLVLSSRGDLLVSLATAVLRGLRLDRTRLGAWMHSKADEVAGALRFASSEGRLAGSFLLSVPLWLLAFAFFVLLARHFGIDEGVDVLEATFASSWAVVANLLPINGFAGAGTQELGWVVGFKQVGVEEALALSAGLGAHLVQLANVVLFGVLGHAAMALRKG
jgi:uncharacterized protein (TIRG00374 family)